MTITIKDLCFAYPNRRPILEIDEWHVNQAEQLFLHGPSGCGKSTLLNILAGMLPIHHGHIQILGTSIGNLKRHQRDQFRAKNIGYVFQQFNLIPYLNAIDNIQLASYFSKRSDSVDQNIRKLLDQLHIKQDDWRKPVANLSIGQQQRIAIARALVNQPAVLIADEPTSSLDRKNRDNFMNILMQATKQEKTTLIFVSHDPDLEKYFNQSVDLTQLNKIYSYS